MILFDCLYGCACAYMSTWMCIAKVGFGRKPALYPARAESRLFDMALKLSKMV